MRMKGLSFFFSRGNDKAYLLKLDHQCNYACVICGALSNNTKHTFRALKDVKREIACAKRSGYMNIDFAGSEPTLHPKLPEMASYVNELGMHPAILTNGSRFASQEFTKKFRGLRSLAIKINFHSHKQALFDEMSGTPGSYKKAMKAIENINRFLDVYPKHSQNFLSASITVTGRNFKDLDKTVAFLFNHGVRVVQFSPVLIGGNVYNHPELLVETTKVLPYLKKALVAARKRKMHYYLCNFAVCLIEEERGHLVPKPLESRGFLKLSFCKECPYCAVCCGITKGHLISRYGRELLASRSLFPKGFFDTFFSAQDLKFIGSLPF